MSTRLESNHNYGTDTEQEGASETFSKLSSRDRDTLHHRLAILGHSPRSRALWMGRIGDMIDKYWRLGWGSNFSGVGRPRILTSAIGAYFGTQARQARNILAVLRSVGICYREGRHLVFQWIPGDRALARARRGEKQRKREHERTPRKKKGRRSEAEAEARAERDQRRATEREQNSTERKRKTHILEAVLATLTPELAATGEKMRARCDDAEKLAASLLCVAAKPAGWQPKGSLGGYLWGTLKRIDEADAAEALEKFETSRISIRRAEAKRIADQVGAQESSNARRAMLRGAAELPEVDQLWIAERVDRALAKASRGLVSPDNPFELERLRKIREDETIRALRLLGVDPPS